MIVSRSMLFFLSLSISPSLARSHSCAGQTIHFHWLAAGFDAAQKLYWIFKFNAQQQANLIKNYATFSFCLRRSLLRRCLQKQKNMPIQLKSNWTLLANEFIEPWNRIFSIRCRKNAYDPRSCNSPNMFWAICEFLMKQTIAVLHSRRCNLLWEFSWYRIISKTDRCLMVTAKSASQLFRPFQLKQLSPSRVATSWKLDLLSHWHCCCWCCYRFSFSYSSSYFWHGRKFALSRPIRTLPSTLQQRGRKFGGKTIKLRLTSSETCERKQCLY